MKSEGPSPLSPTISTLMHCPSKPTTVGGLLRWFCASRTHLFPFEALYEFGDVGGTEREVDVGASIASLHRHRLGVSLLLEVLLGTVEPAVQICRSWHARITSLRQLLVIFIRFQAVWFKVLCYILMLHLLLHQATLATPLHQISKQSTQVGDEVFVVNDKAFVVDQNGFICTYCIRAASVRLAFVRQHYSVSEARQVFIGENSGRHAALTGTDDDGGPSL